MKNKQQNPGFGMVLVSQLSIVLSGVVLLWAMDISLPEPAIGSFAAICSGTLLALATFVIFFWLYRFGGKFAQTLLDDIRRVSGLFRRCGWWHIACIATLAGIGEELLFRGFLQGWLGSYMAFFWAILLSSIVFGLLHYLSHAYFISTVLMSIAFGIGYYLSNSLLMVMVWHSVYDFIALAVIIKFPSMLGLELNLQSNKE